MYMIAYILKRNHNYILPKIWRIEYICFEMYIQPQKFEYLQLQDKKPTLKYMHM